MLNENLEIALFVSMRRRRARHGSEFSLDSARSNGGLERAPTCAGSGARGIEIRPAMCAATLQPWLLPLRHGLQLIPRP